MLNEYRTAKGTDKKRISRDIAGNNKKIAIISAHADSYWEFLHAHNWFFGEGGEAEEALQKQYGRKHNETHPGQPELVREKVTKGKGQFKDRRKYRYIMAGPSPEE